MNNYINCAIECGNYKEALEAVKKQAEKNPKSVETQKKLGFLYRMLEKYEDSIEVFEKLVKRGKIDYDVYYNLGISQVQTGNFEGGRDSLRKCVQLDPENPVARKDLGILYLYMNFVDWAQDELKTAYELDENDPEYAYNYAFSLYKGGQYESADIYFKKAIELDKKDSIFYSSYAENLLMLQKKDEAIENYKKAIKLNPKNIQANFGLAKVYYSQRKYAIARELLEDLIGYTKDAEILNLLGTVYQKLKEFDKAIGIFNNLVSLYPDNHILAVKLAECYFSIGNKEKAKEYASIALEKYPDFSDALKILKEVNKNNE